MRAISPHSRYNIQVFSPRLRRGPDRDGVIREFQEGEMVLAQFEQGGLLDHEIDLALEHFNFSGLPEGVNPLTRIAAFDTEAYVMSNYPEDEREEALKRIDKRLRELAEQHPSSFLVVDMPAAVRPWPNYDEHSVEEILEFQEKAGIDPEKIRLYELENQNRQEIIDEMFKRENPELVGGESDVAAVVQV